MISVLLLELLGVCCAGEAELLGWGVLGYGVFVRGYLSVPVGLRCVSPKLC